VLPNRPSRSSYLVLLALIVAACGASSTIGASSPSVTPSPVALASSVAAPTSPGIASDATASPSVRPSPTVPTNLSADQMAALTSLTKVDDYPLYTMHYRHSYTLTEADRLAMSRAFRGWGCSLLTSLADKRNIMYGRNFDWDSTTPAMLLFYTPDDGYASVAMVGLSFIDFMGRPLDQLDRASLADREPLLGGPAWAFDGMNAKGLVVGWARVPMGRAPYDPNKTTTPSIYLTRHILDHAANVDEAIKVVAEYNVYFGPKLPLHYLVADRSGKSALIEFLDGKMVVTRSDRPWQAAVNFFPSNPAMDPDNAAWRYEILTRELGKSNGSLSTTGAMDLLASVKQGTQWSAVYHPNTGDVEIVMGMNYRDVHRFHLDMQP
jgi:hypothetical protein